MVEASYPVRAVQYTPFDDGCRELVLPHAYGVSRFAPMRGGVPEIMGMHALEDGRRSAGLNPEP